LLSQSKYINNAFKRKTITIRSFSKYNKV